MLKRTAKGSPICTGGAGYPFNVGDLCRRERRNRLLCVGGAHLGGTRDSVNGFLYFSFKNRIFLPELLKTKEFIVEALDAFREQPCGNSRWQEWNRMNQATWRGDSATLAR